MDFLYARVGALQEQVGSLTWGPLISLSRTLISSVFRQIQYGQLQVIDTNGFKAIYGRDEAIECEPCSGLYILKETFWLRMLLFADMGFAESFMLGEFECSDLTAFFELFIRNRKEMDNGTTFVSSLSSTVSKLARRTNTLANSRLNISAHYDISNEMFAAFLSDDMTYSCPVWLLKSNPKAPHESLESAQKRKLQRFIDNAHIKQNDHVLEIGTGWGSFAIAAVAQTGCRVTSVTLSREQKQLAEERIAAAGLTDRVQVLLCDYRALPMPREGPYDKIVSIEMLEAVGREYLITYFECIDKLLKPEGGIAVFQCITMPEPRYETYHATTDFIRRYIFPGGHLPSITLLASSITHGSQNRLILNSLENIGPHYARTLRIWRQNFERNFDSRIRPSLLAEHEDMTEKDVDLFRRKWRYYFEYCEAGFRTNTLGDVIVTVGREGSMELVEHVIL